MKIDRAQTSLLDEIIVDNFAGGGGASTGIELATGRVVDIAINHDPDAILMHKTNHPYTEHYQASVWDIDPREVCRGRPVGLAWFSPDCKHFSKAKGAALVDRNIRGLAWIVLRWAALVRPRVIMLENVEEFQTWGPVRKGKPVKSKAGQTFRKWKYQLSALGYAVEHRELVAADYGAPTTRKRFVLIARCDGRPIVWPERTHAPSDSAEAGSGKCKQWRSAAEIIDWSLPCYSIFATKQEIKDRYGVKAVRPLAENTLRRVIRGVDKFTIKNAEPFIVPTGYGERNGQAPRVHDINAPLSTVVSTVKQNVCEPVLVPLIAQQKFQNTAQDISNPLSTVTSVGAHELVAANLIQYHTEQTEAVRANGVSAPIQTVDASNRYGLTTAHLTEYYGNGTPIGINEPMHTATSHDREALTAVHIAEFKGQDIGQKPERPLRTVTASAGEFAAVHARIVRYEPGADIGFWPEIRELLNRFCGYAMADDELLLIRIREIWYFISDIGLRMLTPRELYNAMGFPPDYIIDRDYQGNEYKKSKQVARCGNAVCPPMAEAVVRANLPEWCGEKISTMRQFERMVAV
ncbi:MAG: DNA cytosine methyltransferase [Faecousia sp.]